ncbi:LacI family DNA-binding transcriptional regulator [Kineococcus indalonis]|uniref:LacI family DNA-binding transcriptional regulator n=1 Tax=Kineococcus indalonis TaxID=2696566 RepID=UPI0014125F54|nr:LacI family DNA-binding transcriptional regulator [Kineococcus indalonis]NAZ86635.1 substrate-binding domain-containing protein [Kineococcus indalonis]
MPATRATTLKDVAAAAGVSIKTVSNVVNDHPHVRPEMRERVRAFIEQLDYRPNGMGRQLRQGRSGLVALAVPNVISPYYGELTSALVTAARRRGLTLLVEQTDADPEREREAADGFGVRMVDGLVFVPLNIPTDVLGRRRDTTPAVLIGENGEGVDLDRVTIDSVAVGDLATTHLLERGRRRIAFLGDKDAERSPVLAQRVEGYRRALRRARVRLDRELMRPTPEWERRHGYDATTALLAEHPDVDAVFAANDLLAFGAMHALRRLGRRVPEDVAVIGVDDVEESRYCAPTLSTVAIDRTSAAEQALALLAERLDGLDAAPRTLTAEHRLVVRESTGG